MLVLPAPVDRRRKVYNIVDEDDEDDVDETSSWHTGMLDKMLI